jgi:hypothetical protein
VGGGLPLPFPPEVPFDLPVLPLPLLEGVGHPPVVVAVVPPAPVVGVTGVHGM